MLSWLAARSAWNWVTVGLASSSFCRIASPASSASPRRVDLTGFVQEDAETAVNGCQVGMVFERDGGSAATSLCWIARAFS